MGNISIKAPLSTEYFPAVYNTIDPTVAKTGGTNVDETTTNNCPVGAY